MTNAEQAQGQLLELAALRQCFTELALPPAVRQTLDSAFTERRFLMECSFPETVKNDYLVWPHAYPARFQLNEGIFRRGDPAALRTARRKFGVGYLLVDLVPGHGGSPAMATRVGRLAPLVYRNASLAVFRVPAS